MALDKPPDAILFPTGAFAGEASVRLLEMKALFGPVLSGGRVPTPMVYVSSNNGGTGLNLASLVPAHVGRELFHPKDGPLANRERYAWFVADRTGPGSLDWELGDAVESYMDEPESIKFGYLRPDDAPGGPSPAERHYAAAKKRMAAMTPEAKRRRVEALKAVGGIDPEAAERLLGEVDGEEKAAAEAARSPGPMGGPPAGTVAPGDEGTHER